MHTDDLGVIGQNFRRCEEDTDYAPGSRWRAFLWSLLDHIVFEGYAFRIVFLKPSFSSVHICENLDVLDIADLFGGVDVRQKRS